MPGGRPTLYNEELADLICMRVQTNSIGLPRLCKKYPELPSYDTINTWRVIYPEFSVKYAQAKLKQAELLAEEILEIADDASGDGTVDENGEEKFNSEFVARSRLRIDTRKWLAAKLLPRTYGKAAEEVKTDKDSVIEQLINKLGPQNK